MSSGLSKPQVEDLLEYLGVTTVKQWKGDKIQFCCPIHGESNPSCGININYSPPDSPHESFQVFNCFSCGAGGTLPWLVFRALPDQFKSLSKAQKFLTERYGVDFRYTYDPKTNQIKRYEDFGLNNVTPRHELPLSKLAPFKSGKETFKYFFNRGFDKDDMRKFMIGRDLDNETVTIPAFWEDGTLAGVIGRYINPARPKHSRYLIYDFPKSTLIYPLDKLQVVDGTIIGCESMFDVIMLHKWGYPNAVAMMGDSISKRQADQIASRCKVFIDLFDNDPMGIKSREYRRKRLGNKVMYLVPSYYPDEGKDPSEWGEVETNKVINSATLFGDRDIPRL